MALSKLRAELAEILPDKGISEINEFQVKIIDAAIGTASKPPTKPRREVPIRAAIIVTAPGTAKVRFIIRGVTM